MRPRNAGSRAYWVMKRAWKADSESLAHEAAEGNEDNTEAWTEGHTCHTSAENLAICFAVRVLEVWRLNSKLVN